MEHNKSLKPPISYLSLWLILADHFSRNGKPAAPVLAEWLQRAHHFKCLRDSKRGCKNYGQFYACGCVWQVFMQVLDKPNQQTELGRHQQIRGVFPAGHV